MPLKYQWSRTVIAGEPMAYDYVCADGDMKVGRIYKHTGGPQSGHWFWSMYAFGPGINRRDWNLTGTEDTKDAATAKVEWAYDLCRQPACARRDCG